MLFSLVAHSQHASIESFYNKYKNLEKVSTVKLTGWLLELAINSDGEEKDKLSQKLTNLRVLIMEEGNLVSQNDYQQLKKSVKKDAFEDLFQIREGKEVIEFMIREKGDFITDVLILVNNNDNFVLLSLEGRLRFSDLNDLNIDIEGGDHFKKIPEHRKDVPRA